MVCKAEFVAICVVPALFTCLGNTLEGRFCRYLRSSRPPRLITACKMPLDDGMFHPCSSGDFLAGDSLHFIHEGRDVTAVLCTPRLPCLSPISPPTVEAATQRCSALHVLGMVWKADFVALCVVPALFTCLGNGLAGRFCRYLRSSRSLCMFWVGTSLMRACVAQTFVLLSLLSGNAEPKAPI